MTTKLFKAARAALARRGRGLASDRRGAIAPAAALIMLPITLLAFGAVEFSRYTAVRSNLQDALDAAALAVARSSSTDAAQLQQIGEAVLRSQVPFNDNLKLTSFTVVVQNGAIVTDAKIAVGPIISSLFMEGDLNITGHSEVMREVQGLEVALVLDNTYSMRINDRLGITKAAASDFVDILARAAAGTTTPDALKIGLVPFAATVNVGPAAASQPWMDLNAQSPIHGEIFTNNRGQPLTPSPNRFTLLQQMGVSWAGCVEGRPMPYDVEDTAPNSTQPESLFVPYFAPDEADQVLNAGDYHRDRQWKGVELQSFDYPNDYLPDLIATVSGYDKGRLGYYWYPYKMDWGPRGADPRDQIYTYAGTTLANGWKGIQGVVTKYNGTAVDIYTASVPGYSRAAMSQTSADYGPNRGCTPKPLTRLTTDYGAVKTAINAMEAGGSTNIPMGLVWGWHLLSPNLPFSDGAAYDTKGATKIAVLMTDGENSLTTAEGSDADNANGSEYSGVGYVWQNRLGTTSGDWTTRRNAMDARLTALCTNMKAKGVVVYTIRVEVTSGTPDVLRNCATTPAMFFDVKSASELNPTFRQIAQSIQSLRIAK